MKLPGRLAVAVASLGTALTVAVAAPPLDLAEATAAIGGQTLTDLGHPKLSIPLLWVNKDKKNSVTFELEFQPLSNGRGTSVTPVLMDGASAAPARIELASQVSKRLTLDTELLDAGT